MKNRYEKLTFEQLRGANWAFQLVRTSPRINGGALELIDSLIAESLEEIKKRAEFPQPSIREEDVKHD